MSQSLEEIVVVGSRMQFMLRSRALYRYKTVFGLEIGRWASHYFCPDDGFAQQ
jgi:hypothetical protein